MRIQVVAGCDGLHRVWTKLLEFTPKSLFLLDFMVLTTAGPKWPVFTDKHLISLVFYLGENRYARFADAVPPGGERGNRPGTGWEQAGDKAGIEVSDHFPDVGKMIQVVGDCDELKVLEECWNWVLKKAASDLKSNTFVPRCRPFTPATRVQISLGTPTLIPVSRYFLDISTQNQPCSLIENGAFCAGSLLDSRKGEAPC